MRILVIGGTAFMGPHVIRGLRESGHHVSVFHRGKTGTCQDGAEHIHADCSDLLRFRPEFERLAPDVVVHMIAMNQVDADTTVEAFRGIARRVVVISSMDVYGAYGRFIGKEAGDVENSPLTEESSVREQRFPYRSENTPPDSVFYNYDKIVVEQALLNCSEFETTVLRLPAVYGPHDRQHRTFDYVKRMLDRRPAILLDAAMADWRWSRGYVDDVARSICLAATGAISNRVFNVAEPEAQREYEWVAVVARAMHWEGRIVRKPAEKEHRWEQHVTCDTSRIRSELGYRELVSSENAILRTVAWESEQIKSGAYDRPTDYAVEDELLRSI